MARRKQVDINGSFITLGGVRTFSIEHRGGFDFCQRSATVYRHTEHQAELNMSAGHLSDMHKHLLHLERIGLNPRQYHREYPAAPRQPLWGYKLAQWIGEQVGWSASDVEKALDTASQILLMTA